MLSIDRLIGVNEFYYLQVNESRVRVNGNATNLVVKLKWSEINFSIRVNFSLVINKC